MLKRAIGFIQPIILPILVGIIPTLYHYGNNVEKITLPSLFRMLVFNLFIVVVFYIVFAVLHGFQAVKTANATSVFLIFFNVYGFIFRRLINFDVIRIEHYTLLPLMIMMAIYSIFLITKLKKYVLVGIWMYLSIVAGILVAFNVVKIIPSEIAKQKSKQTISSLKLQESEKIDNNYPDIYYIVMDEFAGFQSMREYWHYDEVDEFVSFLENKNFFIFEESHGSSIDTLHQMASRLNYQEYPDDPKNIQLYFNNIADNQVMRYLKSRGYTTVVFDETNMSYSSSVSIRADHLYEFGSLSTCQDGKDVYGFYFDEFGNLVVDNTMLYAISEKYKKNNPNIDPCHVSMIKFSIENVASEEVPSPRFVFVHLLLPHKPFVFSRDGETVDFSHYNNWNYYIDNYVFSIMVAKQMINNILLASDLENPPVIIIQSDHGARNINDLNYSNENAALSNYPEEFKTLILFALHLPGYDYSQLSQDINPTNTFPIVFNYLFDDNIQLYP